MPGTEPDYTCKYTYDQLLCIINLLLDSMLKKRRFDGIPSVLETRTDGEIENDQEGDKTDNRSGMEGQEGETGGKIGQE